MPNNDAITMYNICRQCPHSGECDDWEQARWDNECPLNRQHYNEHYNEHYNYGGECFDDGDTTGSDGDCTD